SKAIIVDGYPLPHIEELFSELKGATMFSVIDLASAYHQVPLHEDSRDLAAFITHCHVPYGLASAPAAFQKMMATIFSGLPGIQNYLDDIIVYGRTAAEHNKHLRAVLLRLQHAGLQLNTEKCKFNQKSLRFLGHTISSKGLLPDNDHVTTILDAPAPTFAPALRSFLGLTGWFAKLIPNYATEVEPMQALLKGNVNFEWTSIAQESFNKVKKLIVKTPVLAILDPDLPIIVSTDASDYGV
uniref:ribonuclease H n=1 Tax=Latimeria chalumnae TaxID=7897 RepID=H3AQ61_LATCH